MRLLIAILMFVASAPAAMACGGADSRCEIAGGYYLAAPPPGWDGVSKLPVVVYFHGWNGTPEGTFRNRAMVNAVHRPGALFVVPWAGRRYWRTTRAGRAAAGRDARAAVASLIACLRARWPRDPGRSPAAPTSGSSLRPQKERPNGMTRTSLTPRHGSSPAIPPLLSNTGNRSSSNM